jgi:hypothetical protein
MSWIDDFNKYLSTAGEVVKEIQSVTQPQPQTTVATTPIQATQDTKTAGAEATDATAGPSSSTVLLLVGLVVLFVLLE